MGAPVVVEGGTGVVVGGPVVVEGGTGVVVGGGVVGASVVTIESYLRSSLVVGST